MTLERRPGFTLVEVVVACVLGSLLLGVMVILFWQFRGQAEQPMATLGMEQSTLNVLHWLQVDLAETDLQSVESMPNQAGVALESPRDASGNLLPFVNGCPVWNRYAYYTVKQIKSSLPLPPSVQVGSSSVKPALGELSYDEDDTDPNLQPAAAGAALEPLVAANFPNFTANPKRHRSLARNLLVDLNTGNMGCAVYFNDPQAGPTPYSDTRRGEPVIVALTLLDVSERTGQPTVRRLSLQVKPRN